MRDDDWELRKARTMLHWATLHSEGSGVHEAAQVAAHAVYVGEGARPLTARQLQQWLHDYVVADGRIAMSQRGRHASTASFLDDPDIKAQAVSWLRSNVQAARKKPIPGTHPAPPLNVARFHKWANEELLFDIIAQSGGKRRPICEKTACNWLHALGFGYQGHKKMIFFDGHERPDVKAQRMENLVTMQVLREVTVTFSGVDCEITNWPDDLHPGEPPLVVVSQDECAFHGCDDCPWEWCEEGRMSLKQKSRGSLLMVSEFLSELSGRLRCSKAEAEAYAAAHPASKIASLLVSGQAEAGVAARLILEPGATAGKDKYFDNDQLIEQTKLAMEVFDAMARHVAPERTVVTAPVRAALPVKPVVAQVQLDGGRVRLRLEAHSSSHIRLQLSVRPPEVKQLPAVRCCGLFLFDHSSGHAAAASDGRSAAVLPKGPDWNGKVPPMRDGWYAYPRGPSWPHISQRMQFAEGDTLPLDITVPAGIDPDASSGPAAVTPPKIVPEQLITEPPRTVVYTLDGLGYKGDIVEVDGTSLMIDFEDENVGDALSDREDGRVAMAMADVLACLVGPPPDPTVNQEAPPNEEEEVTGCTLWFKKSRKQALKKKLKEKSDAELEVVAQQEWAALPLERRMLWVRKVRAQAEGTGRAPAAPRAQLKCGDPVPRALWGRHKGSEVLLAERGLLPVGGLRGACESGKKHAADNRCCCKRLLGSQPDFVSEVSALERTVRAGRHLSLFLAKYHCELNFIERYWGASKKYARRHCGYTLVALRACIPVALSQSLDELPEELRASPDLPVSPLFKMRRWARVSWRYMAEYRKGASGNAVVRAVAEQSSKRHRDTSDPRARQAEAAMEAAAFDVD